MGMPIFFLFLLAIALVFSLLAFITYRVRIGRKREMSKCPYKKECATVMFWSEEHADFIRDICNTDRHKECLHFSASLQPQHEERQRLYRDPHAHEPNWGMLEREKDCKKFGKKKPNEVPVCNGDCESCPLELIEGRVARLVLKLKSGEVKKFECKSADDGYRAIALAVGKYHYFPVEGGDIPLDEIEDMKVEK